MIVLLNFSLYKCLYLIFFYLLSYTGQKYNNLSMHCYYFTTSYCERFHCVYLINILFTCCIYLINILFTGCLIYMLCTCVQELHINIGCVEYNIYLMRKRKDYHKTSTIMLSDINMIDYIFRPN